MKRIILFLAFVLPVMMINAQEVVGTWKTIDDETGEAKSYVQIYEVKGKLYGKITKLLKESQDKLCTECTGKDKDKPIVGLTILKNLSKDGEEYGGGTIMDPNNGKVYKCYITLEDKDKLKVRGYIGFSLIGRTQYWYRVN